MREKNLEETQNPQNGPSAVQILISEGMPKTLQERVRGLREQRAILRPLIPDPPKLPQKIKLNAQDYGVASKIFRASKETNPSISFEGYKNFVERIGGTFAEDNQHRISKIKVKIPPAVGIPGEGTTGFYDAHHGTTDIYFSDAYQRVCLVRPIVRAGWSMDFFEKQ